MRSMKRLLFLNITITMTRGFPCPGPRHDIPSNPQKYPFLVVSSGRKPFLLSHSLSSHSSYSYKSRKREREREVLPRNFFSFLFFFLSFSLPLFSLTHENFARDEKIDERLRELSFFLSLFLPSYIRDGGEILFFLKMGMCGDTETETETDGERTWGR